MLYFKQLYFNMGMRISCANYIELWLFSSITYFSGALGDYLLKNLIFVTPPEV